jgi:hypothetical protein
LATAISDLNDHLNQIQIWLNFLISLNFFSMYCKTCVSGPSNTPASI